MLAAVWLARLPVAVAAQWWRRRYGLSDAGYLDRLVLNPWLELLGSVVLACVALAAGMLLARRFGRRWWLVGAPVLVVVGAVSVLLQPLVLAPKLDRLDDPALAAEIRALGDAARRAGRPRRGAPGERAHDARRTRRSTGSARRAPSCSGTRSSTAATRTTRSASSPRTSSRTSEAHHVWKGLGWLVLLAPPLVWILSRAARLEDPGQVPRAVLVVVLLQLAVLPLTNAVSRRYEAEADHLGLEATGEPAAAEATFRRFVRTNLNDPSPPAWARILLATHPTTEDRIRAARSSAAPPAGS